MPKVVIYPGSFDPPTTGHASIIRRGLSLFDRVIVAVAKNMHKSSMFSLDERIAMIEEMFPDSPGLEVASFDGLLVQYCQENGVDAILRGLRAVADFEYENQMASMNRSLAPDVETVFLMADPKTFFVSSRLVKEVAILGGNIDDVVPPNVRQRLLDRVQALAIQSP